MHVAARVTAAGADFLLIGGERSMLKAKMPVVAITAVRPGAGRSETTRYVARILKDQGLRVVVVRQALPAGSAALQAWQRFETRADLDRAGRALEEREEYEALLFGGHVVYGGVDHGKILKCAETEADVLVWDGGSAGLPFYVPDLHIFIADPRRPGHETAYTPGEASFRRADVILVNRCDAADEGDVYAVEIAAAELNPKARVVCASSHVSGEYVELCEVVPGRLAEELARAVPAAVGASR
jgi:predicted GTPase